MINAKYSISIIIGYSYAQTTKIMVQTDCLSTLEINQAIVIHDSVS